MSNPASSPPPPLFRFPPWRPAPLATFVLALVGGLSVVALLAALTHPTGPVRDLRVLANPDPDPHLIGVAKPRPAYAPTRPEVGRSDLPPADFISWAILDHTTGVVIGSETLTETSTTASMIKVWLVADYLRLATEAGRTPSPERLRQFSLIIRDSHNGYTQTLFQELGGGTASIDRLIAICGLTDSSPASGSWSNTHLSARDTARMGACLADGRAAGPAWTDWLLSEMRQVRGLGDFGIRHALPDDQRATIAIKNGWVIRPDGSWHVSCLAVGDTWSMGILTRYPADLGYDQLGHQRGAEICQTLAARYLPGFVN